jgi:hypothetical protein
MTTDIDPLIQKVAGGKQLPDDVVQECQSIMNAFSLSAEDLAFKWESHLMSFGNDELQFNVDNLRQLSRDMQADLEAAHRV